MAYLIDLRTFSNARGNLTVIEKIIPFDIKRIFYIYGVDDSYSHTDDDILTLIEVMNKF